MKKIELQLFADPSQKEKEIEELVKDLEGQGKTPPPADEPEKKDPPPADEPEKKDPPPVEKVEEEEVEEEDEEIKKEGGIKGLRKAHEETKKKAKELEEEKTRLTKEAETTKEKLLKAIRLGIKGDTEEEILANLEEHEIKEQAGKLGLTEEQVRKEKELQTQMQKLNEEQKEIVFNRRAYNLQKTKGLTEEQLMVFINEAANIGIDLLTNPTAFDVIYDKIMGNQTNVLISEKDKLIAELEKQIAELKKEKAPAPGPDGKEEIQQIDDKEWEKIIAKLPDAGKR